jgi:glycosyltransferase involved in cell wall biosynthesis
MDLSIILPTYNRAEVLKDTLNSLSSIHFKEHLLEIIVVDNNSTDNTKFIVNKFSEILPIQYVFEKKQGKSNALNSGIRLSRGQTLIFVDDDISFDEDWLMSVLTSIAKYPNINVFGGKILTLWPKNAPDWAYYSSKIPPYLFSDLDLGDNVSLFKNRLPGGANFWVRRRLLNRHALFFNVNFGPSGSGRNISGSESEFLTRARNIGEKILYVPSSIVHHRVQEHELNIHKLCKRFKAEGYSSVLLTEKDSNVRYLKGYPLYLLREYIDQITKLIIFFVLFNKIKFINTLFNIHKITGRIKAYKYLSK